MRLSVWVSISFGIAIATSQTANAWQAINNIDNNVYFYWTQASKEHKAHYDGELALGHTVSCDADSKWCGRGTGKTFSWQYHLSGRCDSGTPPSTYLHTGWLFFPRGFTPRQTTNFILPESKSPCRPQSASSGILPGHMRGDGSTGTCLYATRRQTATGCHNTIERNPTTALGRQRGEIG